MLQGPVPAVLSVLAATALFVLGYHLRFGHRADLIPGFDPATSAMSPEPVAEKVGEASVRVGIGFVVLAVVVGTDRLPDGFVWGIGFWMVSVTALFGYKLWGTLRKAADGEVWGTEDVGDDRRPEPGRGEGRP